LQFDVSEDHFVDREAADRRQADRQLADAIKGGGQDFLNRIRKNLKNLSRWAKREDIDCYRLYDADIPEFAVAVDVYGDHLHVQEYAPPSSIDERKANRRMEQIRALLPIATERPAKQISYKVRQRQRGSRQYDKQGSTDQWLEVREPPAQLLVNLHDYLDTGLFLDHRPIRARIREMADGKRFLNLFCYTGAATVQAAHGGASVTTSVDLSATYLDWAKRNLELNGFSLRQHDLIRADCREWVKTARGQYDLILVDPPTFSTSKRMEGTWDVQRDHVGLLTDTLRLLAPGGTLIFSNNQRKFRFDRVAFEDATAGQWRVEDISRRTLPKDFARNPRIHQCFVITRRK
jgi:23S rRNA (guanine2445-N2)-methyltransferase / 23S rRNA (guanine2069-N7)-methyltransferase